MKVFLRETSLRSSAANGLPKGVMSTLDLLEAFNSIESVDFAGDLFLRSFARRWRRCYFYPKLFEGIPFKKTLLITENISCKILCTTTRRSFKYCILEKDFSEVYLIIRPVEGTPFYRRHIKKLKKDLYS